MNLNLGSTRRWIAGLGLMVAAGVGLSGVAAGAPLIGGFVEAAQAFRVQDNDALGGQDWDERAYPRSEYRAQVTARDGMGLGSFFLRVDLLSDAVASERTRLDVREAYLKLYLANWLDLKAGRQVATWGTGDLIFANDLFAKDWVAFFTGLDDSYLKPPQDLVRASLYLGSVTAELAASPYFTPDELPSGTRLSFYNPLMGTSVGAARAPEVRRPPRDLAHGELFARVHGYQGSFEWAFYGYRGFWPTPQGVVPTVEGGQLVYPRLTAGGASLRGPLGPWLVNIEGAAYVSNDDPDGDDPFVANSQVRGLAGVERSLGGDVTVGVQYYGEYMLDYASYKAGFEQQDRLYDELRSTLTMRLRKMMMNQTLQLSLFAYWGVSDEDWHLRPSVSYKLTDAVGATLGANLIDGEQPHTMFGQFRDNANVYARLRYSF